MSEAEPTGAMRGLERDMLEAMAEDNTKLRNAGCLLAEAALYTVREYDGLHRLALAVSFWAATVANEGGRDSDAGLAEDPKGLSGEAVAARASEGGIAR